MTDLLNCPFCGGEGWLNDYEARWGDMPPKSRCPQCRSCGANLGYRPTPAKAIAAWNRRTPAPQAQPDARAVEGEAVAWRSRPSAVHPLFLDIGHREIDWRHHKTKPSFDGDGLKPEWFDVQPLYLSAPAADDGWRDKAEGLESDLRSAVQVTWRRGAKEWAHLNYIDWLEACGDAREPVAPTDEVGKS